MQSSPQTEMSFQFIPSAVFSMLIHRVVTCLLHGTLVFFHNITGQFPKKIHISSDKEFFWFLRVFFMLFSFLMYCDVCIWQLIPKMCFVLFFSCMDLKRARKYHHLYITHVPRFPGKSLHFNKNFTVCSADLIHIPFI